MGKNSSDKILVVDVETTCWDSDIPENQLSEIIQIGFTEILVRNLSIGEKYEWFIKPKFSTISDYCTKLTGIKIEDLKGKSIFPHICDSMRKIGSKKYTWASYGNGDFLQFKKDCEKWENKLSKKVIFPFSENYIDIGNLMMFIAGTNSKIGLTKALEYFDEKFEGQQHSALWDSYNTAKLLIAILKKNRK